MTTSRVMVTGGAGILVATRRGAFEHGLRRTVDWYRTARREERHELA